MGGPMLVGEAVVFTLDAAPLAARQAMKDFTGHALESDADAVRAVKAPSAVDVQFADSDGVLKTAEGAVHYRRGDALMSRSANDRWPIARAKFFEEYEPLPPTEPGRTGRYCKRPKLVWARRIGEPFTVRVGYARDALVGAPGDWLLQYDAESYGIVTEQIFSSTYEVLGAHGRSHE